MNILDAFIKKHGQFILVIIGKPCTNKSYIAKEFADDLKLPIINMNKYYTDNKFVEKTVNDTSYKLYDHPDNINWDMVNRDVETKIGPIGGSSGGGGGGSSGGGGGGVVLYGNYIDSTKITFKPNFVFFINMNNNMCKTILIKNKLLPYSPLSLTNEAPINPDIAPINPDMAEAEDGDVEAVEGEEVVVEGEEVVAEGEEVVAEGEEEGEADGEEVVAEEGDKEEEDWEQTIDDSNTLEEIGAEGDEPGVYNEEEQDGGGEQGGQGGQEEQEEQGGHGEQEGQEEEQLNNYFTNIFLPLYEELITKIKINKFYNIKSDTKIDKIYDDMFDYLMALIEKDVSPPKKEKGSSKETGKGHSKEAEMGRRKESGKGRGKGKSKKM
jgi:hypothetical protein